MTTTSHTLTIQAGQSLADIALQEYGTVEGMVLILQANPGLGISDELTPGMELIIPGNTVVKTPGTTAEAAPEPAAPIQQITITDSPVKLSGNYQAIKTITVQAGQSLADIALQEYGTFEGVILILQANPGLSVSDQLAGGQELNLFTGYTVNLVKEIVKVEPYASQLQSLLAQWAALIKLPGSGGITTETDPVFTAWLATFVPFSGSYNDLSDKPNIPDQLVPISQILDWKYGQYQPYGVKSSGMFYRHTDMPSNTASDLKYDGNFFASGFYIGSGTASKYYGTDANKKLVPMTDPDTFWKKVGSVLHSRVADDTLSIRTNYGTPAIACGAYGSGSTGLMVYGASTRAIITGIGQALQLQSPGGLINMIANNTDSSLVQNTIYVQRHSGGASSNGIGVQISFSINNDSASLKNSGYIINKFTSVIADAETSSFEWWLMNAGGMYKRMELTGTGVLIVDKITAGGVKTFQNQFIPINISNALELGSMELADDGQDGSLYITMNVNGTLRRARLAIEPIPDPVISNIVISNITDDGFTVTCQINPYGLLTPVLHYGETIAYGLTVEGDPISVDSSVSFVVSGITNFADCFIKVVAGGSQLAYVGQLLVKNAWYGIERDLTVSSADWTRIGGDMTLHASLPVQSSLKGVLLNADKTVNYFLKADDWTKKADGTASVLTGADGNVMVRKDSDTYWKFETAGNIQRVKCSMHPLAGFSKIDKWNIGAYEAKLVSAKLSSVAGILPTTSRTETQFRADARANGAGYNQQWNEPYTEIVWMFIVEYATNNFQKAVNATLTAQGYKQGGLGNGVSTAVSAEWSAFNAYNPFITCGASDSLANGSGEVSTVIANFGGAGINRTFTVPRYRGIENLFGHIWKWVDGVSFNHLAATREVWIFDDPALIADNTSVNARLAGLLAPGDGYVKTLIFDSKGCILPATVGGSSTTYYCDYLYTPALGSGWRALLSGGSAHSGASAGPLSAYTSDGASLASASIGARLFAR